MKIPLVLSIVSILTFHYAEELQLKTPGYCSVHKWGRIRALQHEPRGKPKGDRDRWGNCIAKRAKLTVL
jgi:hypothetical protein